MIPSQPARQRNQQPTLGVAAGVAACLWTTSAMAAPPLLLVPGGTENQPAPESFAPFGFLTGIQKSANLLGDMWGLRPLLSKYGISFAVSETSEVLGNVSGGVKQGFEYDGLTQMAVQLDTQQAFGWYGGTFRASALQIHGRNLSADNLLSLQTASGIEADPGARLWELWYQQKFLDEDRMDVKIGQMSLDQEFIVSPNALLFVNTMFGWPLVPSADLPGGGPAYPLSALGVRLRVRPTDSLTGLLAVTNGNPAPNNLGDPQQQNPSGTSFPLNGGALVFGELQYSYPALGTMVSADRQQVPPGTVKVGFWYNSEEFDDLLFDDTGLSLANPFSGGMPLQHRGNFSLYAVWDQTMWKSPWGGTLNFFTRVMGTPQGDRNPVIFSLNAGATMRGLLPSRNNDTTGFGMGYGRVSGSTGA
ncbi:MAG TPA: carbohydrate porin, partial [Stellaceae bacterium]|nr:carbohydrate porin [Stellaceae bacterium]